MNKKDFKISEAVLVTYHTLDSIYQHFCSGYPKELEEEIVNLITHLMEYIEPTDGFGEHDADHYEIIKRAYFGKQTKKQL